MRSWAWRQWGLGALDFCGGPANTTIVHTTIMASHDSWQGVAARLPFAARGRGVRSRCRADAIARSDEAARGPRRPAKIRSSASTGSSILEARSPQAAGRRPVRRPTKVLEAVANELRSDGPAVQVRRETP
jgi:hypothetical protein